MIKICNYCKDWKLHLRLFFFFYTVSTTFSWVQLWSEFETSVLSLKPFEFRLLHPTNILCVQHYITQEVFIYFSEIQGFFKYSVFIAEACNCGLPRAPTVIGDSEVDRFLWLIPFFAWVNQFKKLGEKIVSILSKSSSLKKCKVGTGTDLHSLIQYNKEKQPIWEDWTSTRLRSDGSGVSLKPGNSEVSLRHECQLRDFGPVTHSQPDQPHKAVVVRMIGSRVLTV